MTTTTTTTTVTTAASDGTDVMPGDSIYGLTVVKLGPVRYALVDSVSGRELSTHASRRVAVMAMWRMAGAVKRMKREGDGK
jgi:hypothetical protein